MSLRFTETEKWNDNWFRRLSPAAKLLWNYICDNCDAAGFYEVDNEMIAFQTRLSEQEILGAWEELDSRLVGASKGLDRVIWIRKFIRTQKNWPLNPHNHAHKGILFILFNHKGFSSEVDSIIKEHESYKGLVRGLLGAKEGLPSPPGIGIGIGKGKEGGLGGDEPVPKRSLRSEMLSGSEAVKIYREEIGNKPGVQLIREDQEGHIAERVTGHFDLWREVCQYASLNWRNPAQPGNLVKTWQDWGMNGKPVYKRTPGQDPPQKGWVDPKHLEAAHKKAMEKIKADEEAALRLQAKRAKAREHMERQREAAKNAGSNSTE